MQLAYPCFARDPVLEEIPNDPNTGTKKLQPGSPVESVKLVQRALWDLWWSTKVDPPITALQYKKQYDIHFPPDGRPASSTASPVHPAHIPHGKRAARSR